MTLLYIGSLLFGGSHLFSILFPGLRDSFRAQLGEKAWKALYGLVSLVGLVLMIMGFARAEPDVIYAGLPGMKHLTMLLVLFAFILIGASHGKGYLKKWLHNPMSLGIVLWSTGHLLVNGQRADIWLFGTFLVVGLADIIMSEIRGKRPDYIPRVRSDILAVVIGIVLYAVFLFGFHPYVLGIPVV
ncbi:NnrU family protein [Aestuariivirga litoralis]|uniref:NnrU family protein n=1 Tax=Aestuariivirga litoralis TaxID=2650924 RepID=A0A2W2BQ41_9HYPH|nr:NnrU family protein [Aestuariivirga litoralis]PZF78309.1 NnrU family protein [Aestuariivirga litoralis]